MNAPIDPDADPALDTDPPRPAAPSPDDATDAPDASRGESGSDDADTRPVEIGGQKGPEPTRYGDWEKKGRCTDF